MDPQAKQAVDSDIPIDDSYPIPDAKPARRVSDFYRTPSVIDRRIHILGVGSVGTFIAHSLRGLPNPPPVTLIFHKPSIWRAWDSSSKELRLTTEGKTERRSGFEAELAIPRARYHHTQPPAPEVLDNESTEPVHSLILTCKAPQVLGALASVKHRLHPDSVILFLQNGLGTIDEVNAEIFPDPETRPHYMVGVNSHGMNRSSTSDAKDAVFGATHAGFGTISLGILPHIRENADAHNPYAPKPKFGAVVKNRTPGPSAPAHPADPPSDPDLPPPGEPGFRWTPNSRYLLRTLLRSPVLCATAFSPSDILQLQLEKLAINSIINPLTSLLDARNGAILYNYHLTRVMRLLLAETSLVIRSLPELAYLPNVSQRFDPGRLETLVVGVANTTKDNVSSMLADVRAGRKTEIEYINGWVVKRGEELGVRCAMNFLVMECVVGKQGMVSWELEESVPFVGGGVFGSGEEEPGVNGGLKVKEGVAVGEGVVERVKDGTRDPVPVEGEEGAAERKGDVRDEFPEMDKKP